MTLAELATKAKRKIRQRIIRSLRTRVGYQMIYRSYWHMRLAGRQRPAVPAAFFTAVPNPDAGIGHQLANWIAGYWFARKFGLKFAHTPFSNARWEHFFGFGEGEISANDLVDQGYRRVILPLFDEENTKEIETIKSIVASYRDKKVVFIAERDQLYKDQYGVEDDIKRKFYAAPARSGDDIVVEPGVIRIAVHVRRGDIVAGLTNANPNLLMRWQDSDYFEKVLAQVVDEIGDRKISIDIFSQGSPAQFDSFSSFPNINLCLDMSAEKSFLHMTYADILITSKSSFSYKPALLNCGIKICPREFWHGYPKAEEWVLAENDGSLEKSALRLALQGDVFSKITRSARPSV